MGGRGKRTRHRKGNSDENFGQDEAKGNGYKDAPTPRKELGRKDSRLETEADGKTGETETGGKDGHFQVHDRGRRRGKRGKCGGTEGDDRPGGQTLAKRILRRLHGHVRKDQTQSELDGQKPR